MNFLSFKGPPVAAMATFLKGISGEGTRLKAQGVWTIQDEGLFSLSLKPQTSYASAKTLVRPSSTKEYLISELET
jgi:hypothetical protein